MNTAVHTDTQQAAHHHSRPLPEHSDMSAQPMPEASPSGQDHPTTRIHAFSNDALGDLDAVAIAQRIQNRQIGIVEACRAAIERAERVNSTLNAIEVECFDKAIRYAYRRESEYLRETLIRAQPGMVQHASQPLFQGIPTFLKDNVNFKSLPTHLGSSAFTAPAAKSSTLFTQDYLKQGFVVLGKTKLPEFGLNASTEYQGRASVRNPWHTDYSTGGSSGGSAALVAAGVVPIAHANDGGGSIRIPAACCGVIGMKPSRGRHAVDPIVRLLPINILSEGVVTRSVRDTAHYMAEMERIYPGILPPIGLVQMGHARPRRIGLLMHSITHAETDLVTQATVRETARLLESMGHHVEEIPFPVSHSFTDDFTLYWGMLAYLLSTLGNQIFGKSFDPALLDNLTHGLASHYRKRLHHTPFALRRLKQAARESMSVFQDYDAILTPVTAYSAPELGYLSPAQPFEQHFDRLLQFASFTPLQNVAGSPAISLPMGATDQGVPVGVQLTGAIGSERMLLELAYALEDAKPWRRIQD